jgi:hypothetical protein
VLGLSGPRQLARGVIRCYPESMWSTFMHLVSLTLWTALLHQSPLSLDTPTTVPTNPLIGQWQVTSRNGRAIPPEFKIVWTIDSSYITTKEHDKQMARDAYAVQLDKTPHSIVINMQGEDHLGWFELKGRDIEIVLSRNTGKPPKSATDGVVIVLHPLIAATGR